MTNKLNKPFMHLLDFTHTFGLRFTFNMTYKPTQNKRQNTIMYIFIIIFFWTANWRTDFAPNYSKQSLTSSCLTLITNGIFITR
jgi:hypothetical protein